MMDCRVKPGHDGKTVTAARHLANPAATGLRVIVPVDPPRIQLQSNTQRPCLMQKRNTSVIIGQATVTNKVPSRS
jgi:hypothetical protein